MYNLRKMTLYEGRSYHSVSCMPTSNTCQHHTGY